MLITDDFVMINFPKTGSSYAREIIKSVYGKNKLKNLVTRFRLGDPAVRELMLPKIDEIRDHGIVDQHGTYRQIPKKYTDKNIISITRNPFSRYKSTYHYKWWQKFPPADFDVIYETYPDFPELSFGQYYEMIHAVGMANRFNRLNGLSQRSILAYIPSSLFNSIFMIPNQS